MAPQPVWGNREDLFTATVKVTDPKTGATWTNTFDSSEGGSVQAKDVKYRPGNGTENELSLGGPVTATNVTVTCLQSYGIWQKIPWLLGICGRAEMEVYKQPLDTNGAPFGKPLISKGKMIEVTPSKTSSQSDTPAMLSLVQSTITPITSG